MGPVSGAVFPALDHDARARLGAQHAGDDLDQCRLARSVFADQAMHLARRQRKVDVAQRDDAAEVLGDCLEGEKIGQVKRACDVVADNRMDGRSGRRRLDAQRPPAMSPAMVSLLMRMILSTLISLPATSTDALPRPGISTPSLICLPSRTSRATATIA